ncbi:MAG: DUF4097 family beta strand repeat protein, partial [Candidatus Latescibacteria bacterium]|nr:DUF4097 family beta strand repeat protein [Candidatus Latescibacterota bacterium]
SGKSSECRVCIEYNKDKYKAYSTYNRSDNRLKVELHKNNLFGDHIYKNCESSDCCNGNKKHVKVTIELPGDPDTDIHAKVKAGEIKFTLGDLRVRNFNLRSWAGATTVDFDTPNKIDLDKFIVHCSIGETVLKNLGNAHFRRANINSGIGQLDIDFNGDTCDGAFAKIDLDIGETRIQVPESMGTEISVSRFLFFSNANCPCGFTKRGGTYYTDNFDDFGKKLELHVSCGIGELKIDSI